MKEVDDDVCVVGGPDWREIKSQSINRKWCCPWIIEVAPAGSLHYKFTTVWTMREQLEQNILFSFHLKHKRPHRKVHFTKT